jgi:hypothetical protein
MANRTKIKFVMRLEGGKDTAVRMERVIRALRPDAVRSNFRKVGEFMLAGVKRRTPGSGRLRAAWRLEQNELVRRDGFRFEARVFNALSETGVTYLSTDGDIKPKLRTYPSEQQQTYGEVLRILDRGGRPHRIVPKRVTVLSWWQYQPGRGPDGRFQTEGVFPVFAYEVKHPGHKKYGMLTETRKEAYRLARAAIFNPFRRGIVNAWNLRTGEGR